MIIRKASGLQIKLANIVATRGASLSDSYTSDICWHIHIYQYMYTYISWCICMHQLLTYTIKKSGSLIEYTLINRCICCESFVVFIEEWSCQNSTLFESMLHFLGINLDKKISFPSVILLFLAWCTYSHILWSCCNWYYWGHYWLQVKKLYN